VVEDRKHDLGKGFVLREYHDPDTGELIGYFVTGPKAPQCKSSYEGRCGSLCCIKPYKIEYENFKKEYSVWTVTGNWPNLTFSPSVMCDCGGQHSFIVNGVWQ
jgi:hypothetical protein